MDSDWRFATVAELEARGVLLVQDGNHGAKRPLPHEIVADGIPHIRAADIADDGSIDTSGAQHVAESVWRRIRKGRSHGGDVLLTHKGTVGRVAVVPQHLERVLCSPQTTFWRSLDGGVVAQRFISAYLRSDVFQAQLRRVMHETDMAPYVSLTNQRELLVSVPPLRDQLAIADVLSALDDKIASNWRQASALHQCAALQVRHATRETQMQSIYEVASVTYGAPFSSKLFVQPGEGRPLIRIRDLDSQSSGIWTTEYRGGEARLIVPSDIVVGMDAQFRAHLWAGWPSWLNQRVCAFDPMPGVSRAYLLEVIKRPLAFYEATKGGTTVIHLGKRDIDEFRVPRLASELMIQLRRDADPMLLHAVGLRRECDSLAAVRDALLPKLVSGRIRVPLSDDVEEQIGAATETLA